MQRTVDQRPNLQKYPPSGVRRMTISWPALGRGATLPGSFCSQAAPSAVVMVARAQARHAGMRRLFERFTDLLRKAPAGSSEQARIKAELAMRPPERQALCGEEGRDDRQG